MKKKLVLKKSKEPDIKLKELMQAIKKAGGAPEQQIKAKELFKNYFKKNETK